MQFQASKFDPENDPERPQLNSTIEVEGKKYTIGKVGHTTMGELMKSNFKEPDLEGFDKVVLKNNEMRPAVFWISWLMEV